MERKLPYLEGENEVQDGHIAIQMGYEQKLQKKFGLISIIGLSSTIMITWEGILFVYQYGMYDGGPLGSIIGFLFCWTGYTLVALCLAEMNSMFPTAGGQYRELTKSVMRRAQTDRCMDRLDMRTSASNLAKAALLHHRLAPCLGMASRSCERFVSRWCHFPRCCSAQFPRL